MAKTSTLPTTYSRGLDAIAKAKTNKQTKKDNVSPPKLSNPMVMSPEKYNINDLQDNDFKLQT